MNWQEPLDFPDPLPPLVRSSSPDLLDRIPSLERDYCSNFSCCGLHLSDLHSLLDHFEGSHVVIVDNSGNPVFPRATGWDSCNDSLFPKPESYRTTYPYTSVVFGYPQVDPHPFDDSHQLQFRTPSPLGVASPIPSMYYPQRTFLDEGHSENFDFAATFDAVCSDTSLSSPPPEQFSGLPPSSFVVETSYHFDPASTYERRQRRSYKPKILGPKPRSLPRKRARAHKCPTVGCSKSYLNPNGLKYHIEKGTCRMESD